MKIPILAASALLACSQVYAAITFTVNFSTNAQTQLVASEQDKFTAALNFWGTIITGYRDNINRNWALNVDVFSTPASGGSLLLGSAGPSGLAFSNVVAGAPTTDGRFIFSTGGNANFNIHPDVGLLNPLTLRHEIGHALGIGTLWEDNQVYSDGIAGNSNRTLASGVPGQYIGANGLAAFQAEFIPGAAFIPVELDGGDGTRDGHWNEVLDYSVALENQAGFDSHPGDGAAAPTVLSGPNAGQSLDNELMTGRLSGSGFLSNTTIQSLRDIGFTVAIPEPSSLLLVSLSSFTLLRRKRE